MRDIKIAKALQDAKTSFEILHDQCAIDPGTLTTGSGTPHKVFTPYHKAWLAEMSANGDTLLALVPPPSPNSEEQQAVLEDLGLFKSPLPTIPEDKTFKDDEERDRIRKLWPAGHAEAHKRLVKFLDTKVKNYHLNRSEPSADATSRMSPYFSSGTISVREALALCRERNKNSLDFSGSKGKGLAGWVREIVFREYYRQLTYVFPHKSMNMPQNLKMTAVPYLTGDEADELYKKWCEGQTGFPLVDAGMRQLNHEAWMHNRARMNTASLLRTNMLIDYRRGERYFAEHLIDWDMSNNSQGWEPSYTVFNPTTQGENNDPTAMYIRKWCPELTTLDNKKVFAPYERCSKKEFEALNYPKPVVDWKETKSRAIEALKHATATGEH
jgi:deoxyribodipyrimidine photo-lyase